MNDDAAILALTGDLHTNSTVAVCPPRFGRDDGDTYVASKYQNFIWKKWLEYWSEIADLKRRTGYPVYFVINGEAADLNKHTTQQQISMNLDDALRLAIKVIEPGLDVADHVVVTRGTEAHSGPGSSMDEIIGRDIDAIPDDDGRHSWYNWRAKIAGKYIDIAHHPGMGHSRPWTRGGDANRLAAMMVFQAAENDYPIPDLVIRGHTHRPSDSGDNHRCRAIILPSWKLSTWQRGDAFGFRLGGSLLPFGGAYALLEKGREIDVRKFTYRWPLRKVWTPNNLTSKS